MRGNTGSGVWADAAYRSEAMEAKLRDRKLKSHIHRKGKRGKPLTEQAVFVKGVVRRFHAASLISGTQASRSRLRRTCPAGCRLRVLPDQRSGFNKRAFA